MAAKKPIGTITRGTTNPNRLRRIDRYIAALPILRTADEPIVVDLGFGASPITAIELLQRLQKVNRGTHVVGIEIDRERVERGLAVAGPNLHFTHGGFEVPLPAALANSATVIRAFNVLRQYDESEVAAAWALMQKRLTPGGVIVEGTCDEIGRLASWVTLDATGPISFTISLRLSGLEMPSKVAERLPKILIHHNQPGEKIHEFLSALDMAWQTNSGIGAFGAAQRWVASCKQLVEAGWPIVGDHKRWRLGEISLDWKAVQPN
ncbi:class I SAM-dependent methyltransferase [Rhodoluna sp.]|uniref:class I SAM-dependent methyltransferase n=1 Tax=Rhodoluna sp. TaxID=1969481 RepID=UPI0025E3A807|nr:class I SAM-dependent methyltransferase [Rhodoluna sp.]